MAIRIPTVLLAIVAGFLRIGDARLAQTVTAAPVTLEPELTDDEAEDLMSRGW